MTNIRFALAQIDTCVGDLDSNADKVMRYAHLAANNNAQVVVFPEMTLTGYPIEDLALRATFRKAAWNKANWLATELAADGLGDLFVVVGTVGTQTTRCGNRGTQGVSRVIDLLYCMMAWFGPAMTSISCLIMACLTNSAFSVLEISPWCLM